MYYAKVRDILGDYSEQERQELSYELSNLLSVNGVVDAELYADNHECPVELVEYLLHRLCAVKFVQDGKWYTAESMKHPRVNFAPRDILFAVISATGLMLFVKEMIAASIALCVFFGGVFGWVASSAARCLAFMKNKTKLVEWIYAAFYLLIVLGLWYFMFKR